MEDSGCQTHSSLDQIFVMFWGGLMARLDLARISGRTIVSKVMARPWGGASIAFQLIAGICFCAHCLDSVLRG